MWLIEMHPGDIPDWTQLDPGPYVIFTIPGPSLFFLFWGICHLLFHPMGYLVSMPKEKLGRHGVSGAKKTI